MSPTWATTRRLLLVVALTSTEFTGEFFAAEPTTSNKESDVKDAKPANSTTPAGQGDQANAAARTEKVEPFRPDLILAPLQAVIAETTVNTPPRKAVIRVNNNIAVNIQLAAQNEALVQQYVQQLRPVMMAELGFVRHLYEDLNPNQRRRIKAEAMRGLKEAARAVINQQHGVHIRVVGRALPGPTGNEPRAVIVRAITNAILEVIPEERRAAFTEGTEQRQERRKQTAIRCMVANLDEQLFLTTEQRTAITESISAKWKPQWEKWTQSFATGNVLALPIIPEDVVGPHLTDDQKRVWRTIPKQDQGMFAHIHFARDPNNEENEQWWGPDEQEPDANAEGTKEKATGNGALENREARE